MGEYIDKEKLLQKLSRMIEYCKDDNKVNGLTALFQVGDAIMDCQTADVEEVKRGKMNTYKPRRMNRNATYKCSVCGKLCSSYYNDVGEWKFCPHCGAKMDLEG